MFLQPVRLLYLQILLDNIHIESYSTVWYRTINNWVIAMLPIVQSDTPGHISSFNSDDLIITLHMDYDSWE
jgi:hypothetical protein